MNEVPSVKFAGEWSFAVFCSMLLLKQLGKICFVFSMIVLCAKVYRFETSVKFCISIETSADHGANFINLVLTNHH